MAGEIKTADGKFQVIRVGQEVQRKDGFFAPATISLIRDVSGFGDCLIDCGGIGEDIASIVRKAGVLPKNIGLIAITHNHPDHIGGISQFPKAKVYMPDSYFRVAKPNLFEGLAPKRFYDEPGQGWPLALGLTLASTPGHAGWDFSVFYEYGNKKIMVVGDLFWSQKDWEDDSEFTALCANPEMQKRSRDYVKNLVKPDIVVPGHGEAFSPRYC